MKLKLKRQKCSDLNAPSSSKTSETVITNGETPSAAFFCWHRAARDDDEEEEEEEEEEEGEEGEDGEEGEGKDDSLIEPDCRVDPNLKEFLDHRRKKIAFAAPGKSHRSLRAWSQMPKRIRIVSIPTQEARHRAQNHNRLKQPPEILNLFITARLAVETLSFLSLPDSSKQTGDKMIF